MVPFGILQAVSQPVKSSWKPKIERKLYWSMQRSYTPTVVSPYLNRNQMESDRIARFRQATQRHNRPIEISSNLTNDELRFWTGGASLQATWSCCRACEAVVIEGSQELAALKRKQHTDETGCTIILVAVYRELLSMRVCAICDDMECKTQKWGIPLCVKCQEVWKVRRGAGRIFKEALEEQRVKCQRLISLRS